MKRVTVVIGTRPEGIKLAPLVLGLARDQRFDQRIVLTGQHEKMLQVILDTFRIVANENLNIHTPGHTLEQICARTMSRFAVHLDRHPCDAVIVQGDTSAAMSAALTAFHRKIPVIHLEAGLRTFKRYSPFPEEMNRTLISKLATLHLAPTSSARENLLQEGIPSDDIVVTGNTVVDALLAVVGDVGSATEAVSTQRPLVLVTTHRRESWGEPIANVARAVRMLAIERPTISFVVAMHPNPLVTDSWKRIAADLQNVRLSEAVDYVTMARLLQSSTLVLTDSGGLQEEAPSLGKPVLVLREDTERIEGLEAGTARLVGTDTDLIVTETSRLLDDSAHYLKMASASNPYGDGLATARCIAAISTMLGVGERMPDFHPIATKGGAS